MTTQKNKIEFRNNGDNTYDVISLRDPNYIY